MNTKNHHQICQLCVLYIFEKLIIISNILHTKIRAHEHVFIFVLTYIYTGVGIIGEQKLYKGENKNINGGGRRPNGFFESTVSTYMIPTNHVYLYMHHKTTYI